MVDISFTDQQIQYAIHRLGHYARLKNLYTEMKDEQIATEQGFSILTISYPTFWHHLNKDHIKKQIDIIRQEYLLNLERDLPLIVDTNQIKVLQDIVEDVTVDVDQRQKAIMNIQKIKSTPSWQKALALSGSRIIVDETMLRNILAEVSNVGRQLSEEVSTGREKDVVVQE